MNSLGDCRFAVDMDLHDISVCIAYVQKRLYVIFIPYLSRDMRFPTIWYV